MEFGIAFKELREDRGFSVAEVARDIVSPQFLRKFEKGRCDTSLTNMMALLYRINVAWDEFLIHCEAETVDQLIQETEDFLDMAVKSQDERLLKGRLLTYQEQYQQTKDMKYLLLSELLQIVWHEFFKEEPSDSEQLSTILRGIESWGHFETFVAIYARLPFSSEELIHRCEQLFRKDIMQTSNYYWACDFIIHVVDYFICKGECLHAEFLLKKYFSAIEEERSIKFASFDLFACYLEGLIGVALDSPLGSWTSEQVIHVYRDILGYTGYAERLKSKLEREYAKKNK